MNISDPIADMLTRIRNGSRARHAEIIVPASRTKRAIAEILRDEGFIESSTRSRTAPTRACASSSSTSARCRSSAASSASASPACASTRQDRHPARARRPRRRHRQHQPRDHDRRPGAQGAAGRRSPGLRLVGRPCHESADLPSPFPSGVEVDDRRQPRRGQGPEGQARARHRARAEDRPGGRRAARRAPERRQAIARAARPDAHAAGQHGHRRDRRLPQGPRDHRRRLPCPARRQRSCSSTWATATRSRSIRPRASPSRSRSPIRLAVVGIDKELVGHIAAASAPRASPSPTRARASATPVS